MNIKQKYRHTPGRASISYSDIQDNEILSYACYSSLPTMTNEYRCCNTYIDLAHTPEAQQIYRREKKENVGNLQ